MSLFFGISNLNYRFEMDTLEIVLKEQLDVVDRFFLAEANFNHKGVIKMLRLFSILTLITSICIEEKTFYVGNPEEN